MNWEFQYVQLTACTSQSPLERMTRWMSTSIRACSRFSVSMIRRPFWKAWLDVVVGDAPSDLVGEDEPEPDAELEDEVLPAARKQLPESRRHRSDRL